MVKKISDSEYKKKYLQVKKQLEISNAKKKIVSDGLLNNCIVLYEPVDNGNDFIIRDFNKAAVRTEKISRKQVLGKRVTEVFPGVKEFGIFKVFQEVWLTGKWQHYKMKEYKDDRISGWRDNYIYRTPDKQIIAIYCDLTKQKQNEEQLKNKEKKYRSIFEAAPNLIVSIDNIGVVNDSNKMSKPILGYTSEEMYRQPLTRFISPAFHKKYLSCLSVVLKKGANYGCELSLVKKSGETIDAVINFKKIGDTENKVLEIVCIINDISALKKDAGTITQLAKFPREDPNPVMRVDKNGVLLYSNPASVPINMSWRTEIGKKLPTEVNKLVRRALRSKLMVVQELEVAESVYTFTIVPVKAEGHVFIYGYDITNRVLAEQELRESEQKFSRLFINNPSIIAISTVSDGKYIDINAQFVETLGYKREEIIGKTSRELGVFVDFTQRGQILKQLKKKSFVKNIVIKIKTKKGETLNGIFSAEIIDFRGQKYLLTVMNDITERERAAIALRESEERYRALVQSFVHSIFSVDKNGTFLFLNHTAARSLGGLPQDFVGKKMEQVFPQEVAADNMRFIRKVLRVAEPMTSESEKPMGKETRWFLTSFQPVLNEKNKPIYVTAIAMDITEQKKAEQEKQALEEQLRHADKMRIIGQLAGGIAHDYNNQLCAVVGFAELIKSLDSQKTVISEYAEDILKISHNAENLNSKLLAYARKGKYTLSQVSINLILGDVVSILKHSLIKKIRIKIVHGANNDIVRGDRYQLQNAILNIALNARDAIGEVDGVITMSTFVVELNEEYCSDSEFDLKPGKYIKIAITDTGCGMDEITLARSFEPFFTTKAEGKGTGMGLPAVYGTVVDHKGMVKVHSQPGRGSTFEIYLPVYLETVSHKPMIAKPVKTSKANILLLDDEDMILEVTSGILKNTGYTVYPFSNGQEAVDYYQNNWKTIDLVILDMVMPKMNGYEVFLSMRKTNPQIRALVLSGYGPTSFSQVMLDVGLKNFVQKPYDKDNFIGKIEEVLTK